MSKRWMSWVVVAALTFGGAGFALGGFVMGARAAGREEIVSPRASASATVSPTATASAAATATATATPTAIATSTPTPRPAPVRVEGELSIRRMQVTSGIDQREPVDHPSSFGETDERVYAFVDVANQSDDARTLSVTFENGQRSTGHVTLEVPAHSARFRTWAWTRLSRTPGEWTAIIRDERGTVLATDAFEIR